MLFLEAKLQIFLKRTENNLSKKGIRCVVVHEVCTTTLPLLPAWFMPRGGRVEGRRDETHDGCTGTNIYIINSL